MWFQKQKSFKDVAEAVLRLKLLKSKNTQLSARLQIKRLIRFFGKFPIGEISETLWNNYLLFEQSKKPRRYYDDRKYMRMILLHALREGMIEKKIPLPIPDIPRQVGREVTESELLRLKIHAGDELALQIEIAWKMGFRKCEMLALRLDQFNWSQNTITLLPSDTKTRRGRVVPIPPDLVQCFKVGFERSKSPFLFPSPTDPSKPQSSNKSAWIRCKRDASVRTRWHDLRHTCATLMLRRGVKRHVVKTYLGMSEKVLLEIYAHLDLADLQEAAAAMVGKH